MVYLGKETRSANIVSLVLSMLSIATLSVCLSRRVEGLRKWRRLPPVCWLILAIYIDSIIFAIGSSIISHGFGVDSSPRICKDAIVLCLACYMTTKVFIYYFLVERVYIIQRPGKPRWRDSRYRFNFIFAIVPYIVVIVLNVVFRFATFDNGECRIGMETAPMVALILVDFFVNCVLTVQFLHPLSGLLSFKKSQKSKVRTVALRTLVGSTVSLISSLVNLAVVAALKGEPGWICLMCCNLDILLTVLVLHWVTSKDNVSTTASHPSFPNQPPPSRSSRPRRTQTPHPDIENFEVGLSDYMRKGGVTTLVTAASHDFDEDEDGDGIREAVPPNTIKVECEHTQEVVEVVQLVGDSRDFAEEKEREASGSRSQEREACSEDSKGRRDSLAALC